MNNTPGGLVKINDLLRYALNELRAIDSGMPDELPTDRAVCAKRLRKLANWLENGYISPDANAIIHEACNQPIQR